MKSTNNLLVAGCGRCGLTLTMQMLDAGGFPCYGTYPSYEDHGAFLAKVPSNLAVKLVDKHMVSRWASLVPLTIMCSRKDKLQQAFSVAKMAKAFMGVASEELSSAVRIANSLIQDDKAIFVHVDKHSRMTLCLQFEDMLSDPQGVARSIASIVKCAYGNNLDVQKMASVVIPRTSDCYPGFLEVEMLTK